MQRARGGRLLEQQTAELARARGRPARRPSTSLTATPPPPRTGPSPRACASRSRRTARRRDSSGEKRDSSSPARKPRSSIASCISCALPSYAQRELVRERRVRERRREPARARRAGRAGSAPWRRTRGRSPPDPPGRARARCTLRGERAQRLVAADVARRLLAADVLLARLHRQHERRRARPRPPSVPTMRPGMRRRCSCRQAKKPNPGPPKLIGLPSGCPSPTTTSAPYSDGGASTPDSIGFDGHDEQRAGVLRDCGRWPPGPRGCRRSSGRRR